MTSSETAVLSAILSFYDNTHKEEQSAAQKTAQTRDNVRALLTRISEPAQSASGASSASSATSQTSKRQREDDSLDNDTSKRPCAEKGVASKDGEDAPTSSATDLAHKFIMILEQTRVAHEPAARGYILFLRYNAANRVFCDQLLEAIGEERLKYRFLIAPKFVNRAVASLFETTIAQTLGLIARVYDNIDQHKWDGELWQRCERSPHRFLDSQTTIGAANAASAASERMDRDFVRDELAKKRAQHLCGVAERYTLDMQQFLLWLANSLDSMRVQLLPHYSFRVFMHLYLDLVWLENNASDANLARQFFERFVHHFEHRREFVASLLELRKVTTRDLMLENEYVRSLRGLHSQSQKCILNVSRECYRFLQHAMRMDLINRSVQTVTRSFIDFQVAG